jgi:hypothetical protein
MTQNTAALLRFIALPLIAASLGVIHAQADTIAAVQSATGAVATERTLIGSNQSTTNGWSFIVGSQDLELDALGLYDPGADGLADSHNVGIWTSGGTLLAEVTIPSGIASAAGYLYESVSPLTLAAGEKYVLGAYYGPQTGNCFATSCGDSMLLLGTETFAPGITFDQARQTCCTLGAGSLAFPNVNAGVTQGIFGPNFLVTEPDTTPEPSSFVLAALAIGVAVFRLGVVRMAK